MKKRIILAGLAVAGLAWYNWPADRVRAPVALPDWPAHPYGELDEWPELPARPINPAVEARIDALLANMTLHEKVAQMTQAELKHIYPDQLAAYPVGSILNGGGVWPNNQPTSNLDDWLAVADDFWQASTAAGAGVPLLWGTDAVHGHNNLYGATLFPHNIALGATADPDLTRRTAIATAQQVVAAGQDWNFAPAVSVAKNPRWGRTYESFSQSGDWVYPFAKASIEGIQSQGILATAKHFIADGGTRNGTDQGNSTVSEAELIRDHALGYYAAIEAGVETIMVSFSEWQGQRMHEHAYLLTDILKGKLGFDGFLISDYNAIAQIYGCQLNSCPQAVNAGIDMFMVPNQWQSFIDNTVAQVTSGEISEARIDDAVRRILRVKIRSGHIDKPMPSQRRGAGNVYAVASGSTRALAQEAVKKSLVLLKNNEKTLPLKPDGNYLLLGMPDSIARQAGGWSLNWQGGSYTNNFFPGATTVEAGLRQWLNSGGGQLQRSVSVNADTQPLDGVIVVTSERSFAEMRGDIVSWVSTAAERQNGMMGLQAITQARKNYPNLPIAVIHLGARPLWMTPQIDAADAFVMAWLPGTEGAAIADVLFGESDFTGRLPINWPNSDCTGNPSHPKNALFPLGYGLDYTHSIFLPAFDDKPALTVGTKGLAPDCVFQNHALHRNR